MSKADRDAERAARKAQKEREKAVKAAQKQLAKQDREREKEAIRREKERERARKQAEKEAAKLGDDGASPVRRVRGRSRGDDRVQLVDGGHVRRIRFDADEPGLEPDDDPWDGEYEGGQTTTSTDRTYRPRHVAPIDEIEFEIDHLDSIRAGITPRRSSLHADRTDFRRRSARTIYESPGGAVTERHDHSGRRVLYTRGSSALSERRFTEAAVDEVVRGVDLSEEVVVRETVTEYVPKSKAEGLETVTVKARRAKADDLNPQCLAVTAAGKQCRNPARDDSDYCGAHKGYQPLSAESVLALAKDTKPRVKGAPDTKPGASAKTSDEGLQPQCAAVTAAGAQCRNSSRSNSKYCGAHKGYRPAAAAKKLTDTKPRTKGKDTKARTRR